MFLPHGEYRIELKNDVLLIEAKGPFNIELVKQYTQEVDTIIKTLIKPWGQVLILHQDCLFTPEAERLMYRTVEHRKKLGLVASAVVFADPQSRFIIEQQLSNIYQMSQVQYRCFEDEVAGTAWVDERLANYS